MKPFLEGTNELQLKVLYSFAGYKQFSAVTLFRYDLSVAELKSVGPERVAGSHLVIPLRLKVAQPGHYEVTANLIAENTGRPVTHLSESLELTTKDAVLELKAHISVLKASNEYGPYVLKNFTGIRLPDKPDELTQYANLTGEYRIGSHPQTEYQDEEYVNERVKTKMKQFQNLIRLP
ncbi:MAG: hypothetical protein HQM12_07475 [SAR324 cluster bacterium]|nr:hypothetical protein [SAR324 cluster bacterium]